MLLFEFLLEDFQVRHFLTGARFFADNLLGDLYTEKTRLTGFLLPSDLDSTFPTSRFRGAFSENLGTGLYTGAGTESDLLSIITRE